MGEGERGKDGDGDDEGTGKRGGSSAWSRFREADWALGGRGLKRGARRALGIWGARFKAGRPKGAGHSGREV